MRLTEAVLRTEVRLRPKVRLRQPKERLRVRETELRVWLCKSRRDAGVCEAKQTGQTCLVVAGLRTEAELRHTEVKPRQPKARLRAREIELRERLRKARRGAGGPPTAHEPSSPSCEGIDLLRGSRMRACT